MVKRIESEWLASNVFVVSNETSCFVIDAGAKLETVLPYISDKKVEAIFLTHGHFDHCTNVLEYAKHFGCKIYASKHIQEYLKNADYNYSDGKFSVSDFSSFVFLEGEGVISLDSFDVKYKQLGGHSKSDMMYICGEDAFVGDVLIGRDMGRIDLYGGDKNQMKETLSYLKDLQYETMHSGHGLDNSKQIQDKVAGLWLRFLDR